MIHRTRYAVTILVSLSFGLLNVGLINTAHAGQKNTDTQQQKTPNRIEGKVSDMADVTGYTYIEVDTGEEKIWAAGPHTEVEKGDTIAFSTEMPMVNFYSKSMNRDFPIIYFVSYFVTDKDAPTDDTAAIASPHVQIKQEATAGPIEGIDKVEGGNTIAEIYTHKRKFSGKTLRVRGQVTKFTSEVMGKNWLHIRDSSTLDDLTVTTDSAAVLDDVVIIEGKLELDKDYGYGYVYPVILEDASVTKE